MLWLAASRGGAPKRARALSRPEVLPLPAETSRDSIKGGPARSGTVQSLKCCPSIKGAGPSAAPGSIKGGAPKRARVPSEPEVLPLPAETSCEAPKCCAWQHRGGGPLKPLPAETSREAQKWAPSRACQQKRAARLKSAVPGMKKGGGPRNALSVSRVCEGPRNALGYLSPEPEVLPLPAETSREAQKCCAWQHEGGGPRNALGHRPEPEVLPLPAETSREAQKCCAGSMEGGGPETRSGTVQSLKCCPCQQKRAARLEVLRVLRLAASRGGAWAPSRA